MPSRLLLSRQLTKRGQTWTSIAIAIGLVAGRRGQTRHGQARSAVDGVVGPLAGMTAGPPFVEALRTIAALAGIAADPLRHLDEINEFVGLTPQFVGHHGGLGCHS